MPVLAYGLNHRTADVDLRGQLAFAAEDIPRALHSMQEAIPGMSESVILSTCNRTEIHCVVDSRSVEPVLDWLATDRQCAPSKVADSTYELWDNDAAKHAIQVAAGLDSQVLGETQIFGQFKDAYEISRSSGHIGRELNLVNNVAIQTAKKIRTDTAIGHNPVSVSYAAVKMIHQLFTNLGDINVLLIGAGTNIRLLLEHITSRGVQRITIANRTLENGRALANTFGVEAMPLTQVNERLHEFDVVMSSTASTSPILGQNDFVEASRKRKHKAILVVDIAIPRDISAEVAELNDVYLYTVDDITGIIEENLLKRGEAAKQANQLLQEGVQRYQSEYGVLRIASLLRNFRAQNEITRQDLLDDALSKIQSGQNPEDVLVRLSQELTNQLSHKPTMLIRHLGKDQTSEQLKAIKQLFEEGN